MNISVKNITVHNLHDVYKTDSSPDAEKLASLYSENEASCFAAYHKKRCTGYVFARKSKDCCEIVYFSADFRHIKDKTAALLLLAVEDFSDKNNIRNISIDIESVNQDTIEFFTSRGYIKDETIIRLQKQRSRL